LQTLMWDEAGIVRDEEGLRSAARTLSAWQAMLASPVDRPQHELANLVLVARLVVDAALHRTESRGAHYRTDFPRTEASWLRHQIYRSAAA
jgi:L-aspartate oxidase